MERAQARGGVCAVLQVSPHIGVSPIFPYFQDAYSDNDPRRAIDYGYNYHFAQPSEITHFS